MGMSDCCIILFGCKRFPSVVNRPPMDLYCLHCGNCTQAFWYSEWVWFSICFIPVIPLYKRQPTLICRICGMEVDGIECRECNCLIPRNSQFCGRCGKTIRE